MRDLGERVGMKAQSLYSYFASKNDIYDAMFGQAWQDCLDRARAHNDGLPADPRAAMKSVAHFWSAFYISYPQDQVEALSHPYGQEHHAHR